MNKKLIRYKETLLDWYFSLQASIVWKLGLSKEVRELKQWKKQFIKMKMNEFLTQNLNNYDNN